MAPQLVLAIFNAWQDGDLAAATAAQNRQNEFLHAMASASPDFLAVAKGVLNRLGIMDPYMALPKTTLDAQAIDQTFEAIKPFLPVK